MSVVEQVRRDHADLARVLKKHKGIRRTVEELYPDSAHFIYELLQNAEDTHASHAVFRLTESGLYFEHDGRPFTEADIRAITDIGEGTKAEDTDSIGRFGVGFKAVFAYTDSPRIWSPTFSFEINDLVLPHEISGRAELGKKTCFEFPFNNPKKTRESAYAEVLGGLEGLAETTLLFLKHLQSIAWRSESNSGEILREAHSEHHIEVLKLAEDKTVLSRQFLRFHEQVDGLDHQRVAVAFALDNKGAKADEQFDNQKSIASQLKIVPAKPGTVSVFFPAEKENSGLRFHIHAPFVPELSRASIKDTPANSPLLDQIATLCAMSLHHIRDLGLLGTEFLGVLPNAHDDVPERYSPIRSAIVQEMNDQSLTPTKARGYAPAKRLLQGKGTLKSLLGNDDLRQLLKQENSPSMWAVNASQKNSDADRFLQSLEISKWDVEEFYNLLQSELSDSWCDPEDEFLKWLSEKSAGWLQALYAFLLDECEDEWDIVGLEDCLLVRLSDGTHVTANSAYFPTKTVKHDPIFPRVEELTFTSGKKKLQQSKARDFLEHLGVREVGENELVQSILEKHYTEDSKSPSNKLHNQHIRRFVTLVENERSSASLFGDYYIFESKAGWGRPADVFLDEPLEKTGLSPYFDAVRDELEVEALSPSYGELKISVDRFVSFAKRVGVISELPIQKVSCWNNPQWNYLRQVSGERRTSPVDADFTIAGLPELLENPSEDLSRLIWRTMRNLSGYPNQLTAKYQKNDANGAHYADSQLVHHLRNSSWIPQAGGIFVKPEAADGRRLPVGFEFDADERWLEAIEFGVRCQREQAEHESKEQAAKALGFSDLSSLERAKEFAMLPIDEQHRFLASLRAAQEFPQHESKNKERRLTRVRAAAQDAPKRAVEKKIRSVSVGREAVKEQTDPYLRDLYSDDDDVLFCQICGQPMPFRLDDGSHFYEMVEFLGTLKKRYHENYLALCPNHAAMFRWANRSRDVLLDLFVKINSTELEVDLAGERHTIRFTQTHIDDLNQVVNCDQDK